MEREGDEEEGGREDKGLREGWREKETSRSGARYY